MTYRLLDAVVTHVSDILNGESKEQFIRLEGSYEWPIVEATTRLLDLFPDLLIGPLDKGWVDQLSIHAGVKAHLIEDAAELTKLRNQEDENRRVPVLLLGEASGEDQAGLRDLHWVIRPGDIIATWSRIVVEHIDQTFSAELDKRNRASVTRALLEMATSKRLPPKRLDEYFSSCIDSAAQGPEKMGSDLYLLNLMPDENLPLATSKLKALSENQDLVRLLREDYFEGGANSHFETRISKSSNANVQSFARWLKTRESDDLRGSDIAAVKDSLKTIPGPTGLPDLFATILDQNQDFPESLLEELSTHFDDNFDSGSNRVSIIANLDWDDGRRIQVGLEVNGDSTPICQWAQFDNNPDVRSYFEDPSSFDEAGPPTLNNFPLAIVKIEIDGETYSKPILPAALMNILDGVVDAALPNEFLYARSNLLRYSSLLNGSSRSCLELLFVSKSARDAVARYVTSWKQLMAAACNSPTRELTSDEEFSLALLDGSWSRAGKSGETSTNPVLKKTDTFESVELLPIHIWRLEPILELAMHAITGRRELENCYWALDRSVPLFRILDVGGSPLFFRSIDKGSISYVSRNEDVFSPISTRLGRLKSVTSSYASVHPWVGSGTTINIVNFPSGGGLRTTINAIISSIRGPLGIRVFRETSANGLDDFLFDSDDIAHFDVNDIASLLRMGAFDSDISFVFLSTKSGAPIDANLGGHSEMTIRLKQDGLTMAGEVIKRPELVVAQTDKNETVTLLAKLGSNKNVATATINLTLDENQLQFLPVIANKSQWIVVGASAIISAFALSDLDGNIFTRIAEFEDGLYKFMVFARNVEAIADPLKERVRQGFIDDAVTRELMVSKLNQLLQSSPQKLFGVTQGNYGAEEAVGLIVAREISKQFFEADDEVIEVSLDDFSWTKQWIGGAGKRADLIQIGIPVNNLERPVKVLIVESKATTAGFISPNYALEPFQTAVAQVRATKKMVESLLLADHLDNKVLQVQRRTFIEILAAKSAAAFGTSTDPKKDERYESVFQRISQLSLHPTATTANGTSIIGLATATFLHSLNATKVVALDDNIVLVSTSELALKEILSETQSALIPEDILLTIGGAVAPALPPHVESTGDEGSDQRSIATSAGAMQSTAQGDSPSGDSNEVAEPLKPVDSETIPSLPELPSAILDLRDRVFTALRRHSEFVQGRIEATVLQGPTFSTLTFPFARGGVLQPLQTRESDIARDLGVTSVEIHNADVPGRIQVLVPRVDRQTVRVPDVGAYEPDLNSYLPIAIGAGLDGEIVRTPLSSWPHALVAGSTGSGKTQFLKSILEQLNSWGSKYSSVVIVDGKAEADYILALSEDMYLPQFPEPMFSASDAVQVFDWLLGEIDRRRSIVRDLTRTRGMRVDARALFAETIETNSDVGFKPLIVIIDEFNDIMIRGGQDKAQFENLLTSIAQTARSVLVHVILATQRPDRNVVSGPIKANLGARIAFRLPTAADSVTVLGHGGAEKLLGSGDMLFQLNGVSDQRIQGFLVD